MPTASSKIRSWVVGLALLPAAAVAAPFAYITNADDNSMSVIDTDTNTVVDTINGLGHPFAVAVHPNGRKVYVSGASSGVVHVIDAYTNTVTRNIVVPGTEFTYAVPWGIAVTPDGSRVYVNNGFNSVSVINTTTETVTATIPVTAPGYSLQGLNINATGTRVYTADVFSGTVSVIDATTNTLIAAPTAGTRFAIPNLSGTKVYGFEYGFNEIAIIDASSNTISGSISVPYATCNGLSGGVVNPSGTRLYISCGNSGRIGVIDLSSDTYLTDFSIGAAPPFGIDFLPDGSRLYVNNSGSNTVVVVDPSTNAITASIPVGDEPHSDGKFIGPDFICGDTVVDPGEGCDDGNMNNNDGCTATCKVEHDTVVKTIKPQTLKIKSSEGSTLKTVKVSVVNADIAPTAETPGHDVEVSASSNCPTLSIGSITYAGVHSTGVIAGGASSTVKIQLLATSASTTFNKKAPTRCRVTVTANAIPAFASVDSTPANNTATFDVNVIDQNDPQTTTDTVHETTLASVKPLKLTLDAGDGSVAKKIKFKAGNADYLPDGEAAALHSVSVTASDGTCPAMTLGSATFGEAATAEIAGGKATGGSTTATIQAAAVVSPNALSPARCRVTLTANGPTGDTDSSNNTTQVDLDIFDENDF